MAYDYSGALALAVRQVADKGRPVTFAKTSGSVGNPAKPLHGPGEANPPIVVPGVMAVFVEPSSATRLGASSMRDGVWRDCTQIALVAPDGVNAFDQFTSLTDSDGSTWKIDYAERLQPGPIALLFFIGVKR